MVELTDEEIEQILSCLDKNDCTRLLSRKDISNILKKYKKNTDFINNELKENIYENEAEEKILLDQINNENNEIKNNNNNKIAEIDDIDVKIDRFIQSYPNHNIMDSFYL